MDGIPPPAPDAAWFAARDAEHIRLLVLFHYLLAGLTALAACLPVFHLLIGIALVGGGFPAGGGTAVPPEMETMGWFFIGAGAVTILVGWACAVAVFLAGRFLSQRRHWTFVFVVACLLCLSVPLGTALGVCTILVLQRPTVKGLFGEA